ncbi:MAG: magnesium-translocating P-type ATPase [Candidatus Omnitrophica bacterium]|nr:magnesium-translocating P-type ATPase [Candidatus Omnitrophota bacterium]
MPDTLTNLNTASTNCSDCAVEQILQRFSTSLKGLSAEEARTRIEKYGPNEPAKKKKRSLAFQILLKFFDPLIIVLLIIAGFSYFFGEKISAFLVVSMAVMSVVLSFFQEYRAGKEADKLSEMVRATATVFRNGKPRELPIRELVPGDIVNLSAGDMIPADLRIISGKDLFLNQSSLTGESFPVEKSAGPIQTKSNSASDLTNIAFMGSSVISGAGLGVVVRTGLVTQFGEISRKLASVAIETSFEKGIKNFTWLMIRFMMILVVIVFAVNAYSKGNLIQALLFALAVAVGLTPEMLPMLVALNLSKGAIAMSKKKVIVKRLNSIQNFGAMDVLCTDKTGTLTMDKIVLEKHCDVVRKENQDVLKFAYLNSFYQTGLKNILDQAVLKYEKISVTEYKKIDEIPFDFSRRMMSVIIETNGKQQLITKGAPEEIFKRCTKYELDGEMVDFDALIHTDLKQEYENLSADGFRVLAIAYKNFDNPKAAYSKEDEQELILKGYIAFLDPPKPSAKKTIESLRSYGIDFKVLTGDNDLVAKKICLEIGIDVKGMLTGEQIEKVNDDILADMVKNVSVFSRLSPMQKERVIRALRKNGHTVGYMGDGINDAPALKAADVGISVDNAVDIAKESADIILLQKSLMVLQDGVIEGRKTFGNILKYVKMSSSSNFGNMFSMVGASILLPFLPMLPIQILLNNFLYDLSQVAIPTDEVDVDYLKTARPWNVNYIKKFMLLIGPVSSIFDYITFGVLWFFFHASAEQFQTGWFLESLCTQTLVIHIIRTGKIPFLESRASQFLTFTSIYIVTIGLILPFTPLGHNFGFVAPPALYFLFLIVIVAAYLFLVQFVKTWFIKKYGYE